MQGIPEMREWQASFIPQEANRATIQQYSLDIGRPSHGSPCLPGQGLKPISFITFRHGSSRALIQDLLFLGLPLWEYNFAEADFGIQA
jgi:hypothetical protein